MPGDSGVTVVTNARAYYQYTRGYGRIGRPAFPAPSEFRGRNGLTKLARMRGEIAKARLRDREAVSSVIACDKREAFVQGSEAKQSIFFVAAPWIASLRSQ